MVLKLQGASESSEGLVKTPMWGPRPRVSDWVGLQWDLCLCISHKVPGEADAPETTEPHWKQLVYDLTVNYSILSKGRNHKQQRRIGPVVHRLGCPSELHLHPLQPVELHSPITI